MDKIRPLREDTTTFESHREAFEKSFTLLHDLYSGKYEDTIVNTLKRDLTPHEWSAKISKLRLPTAKACWNAIVMMREKASTDDEKSQLSTAEQKFRAFIERPYINMATTMLFEPFKE